MRLLNLSDIVVPRALWQGLAQSMGIGGILPGAIADDLGMYRKDKRLHVTIRRSKTIKQGFAAVSGSYTFGRITLSPCQSCTSGFLTQVYLHELVHAWLHQYHEEFFIVEETCQIAEDFANAAFQSLNGRVGTSGLCSSYALPSGLVHSDARVIYPLIQQLANQLNRLTVRSC